MVEIVSKKIRGSTLIEVLIAMVIVMVVFSISVGLFSNVLNSGVSFQTLQVKSQLKCLSSEVTEKGFIDAKHLVIDSVEYEFSSAETEIRGLDQLEVRAHIGARDLGKVQALFKTKPNDKEN